MKTQTPRLAAGLIACALPAWAVAPTELPTYETYLAAADSRSVMFDPAYVPQTSSSSVAGDIASISGKSYTAFAYTALGSNHVYAHADVFTPPA